MSMGMYCNQCKQPLRPQSNYCPHCGAAVTRTVWQRMRRHTTMTLVIVGALAIVALSVVWVVRSWQDASDLVRIVSRNANTTTSDTHEFDANLIGRIAASVVSVYCPASDGSDDEYRGSGTILTTDGIVITNSHVIPQRDNTPQVPEPGCLVTLPDPDTGAPSEMYYAHPVILAGWSDEYDLAILKLYDVYVDEDGTAYGHYPNTFPAFDDADVCVEEYTKLGEPVKIFGYPASSNNFSLTITEGVVSNFPEDKNTILTSAKVDSGNSGGLAVDRFGCQLGIPTAVNVGEYENLGVIITTEAVHDFLDKYYESVGQ